MATAVITGQDPDQYDFTNPATPVLGTVVRFQTAEGNNGSVFVAHNRYNVKNVRLAVSAAAKLLDEVAALHIDY